ncbi:MAG: hypothetical protein KDC90_18105, partial [Ignavibacteriae bacterium]|nr:hypothetical protein [Ignavibacteriota bacterium]
VIVQMGIQQENMSFNALFNSLKAGPEDFVDNYDIEIIIALLFHVILAVESTYEYPLAGDILDGMTSEFAEHLVELGCNESDIKNALKLYHKRIGEYYEAERNKAGDGPAYWLGKKFLENITRPALSELISKVDDHNKNKDLQLKMHFLIAYKYLFATFMGIKGPKGALGNYKIKYN